MQCGEAIEYKTVYHLLLDYYWHGKPMHGPWAILEHSRDSAIKAAGFGYGRKPAAGYRTQAVRRL
jgi:hypothetical protein